MCLYAFKNSGVFTFPSTGIWLVSFNAAQGATSGSDTMNGNINLTTNNSSYADVAGFQDGCSNEGVSGYCSSLIDVTDTANVKVSFSVGSIGSGSSYTGSTTKNSIIMTFLRLGDT